ncbi:hypothetical protein CHS0354_035539 [Potamilus streckersoni]|uniref:G-protein coupled receptors family 1 profile domain-containing protein n=1 Tax=Potamilus streckersoni TaxID=2493646 RepID=A0AAE0RST8_9BIVA|nr:hypothetical protein CHS0354_035539 [Potamilus streckersoni]
MENSDNNPEDGTLEPNLSTTAIFENHNPYIVENLTFLKQINDAEVIVLLPVIVFYVIIMVSGIIGNIFVLIIYTYRFKRMSAKFYILSLAILDLIVCCIGIPYHLLDVLHPYTYFFSNACKALTFLITFFTFGSIYVLLVVGVDRFLKICRPLKKQVSDFGRRKACFIAIGLGLISSWPQAVIYGHSSVVPLGYVNITGVECFVDDFYQETKYPIIYLGFTFFIAICIIITLIVLYSFICYKIYIHDKYKGDILRTIAGSSTFPETNTHNNKVPVGSFSEEKPQQIFVQTFKTNNQKRKPIRLCSCVREITPERNLNSLSFSCGTGASKRNSDVCPRRSRSRSESLHEDQHSGNDRNEESLMKSIKSVKERAESVTHSHQRQNSTRKITLMMFSITIMFIISYIPYIAMSVADSLVEDLWKGIGTTRLVIYDFFLRSYVINNMVNPIIYGFWDDRFRLECIRLIRRVLFCHFGKLRREV